MKSLQIIPLLALFLLGGCEALGFIAYKTTGAPKTPAIYMPLKEPMLVLAENYKSPGSPFVDTPQVERFVAEQLRTYDVVPVVDQTKLNDLKEKEGANYRKMSVAAIGRAVGAKQVLYLDVTRASMENIGAEMTRAGLDISVKIIDADTGATRWPQETTAGYPISAQSPYQKIGENVTELTIRENVARSMAEAVVKLLRSYKEDE